MMTGNGVGSAGHDDSQSLNSDRNSPINVHFRLN